MRWIGSSLAAIIVGLVIQFWITDSEPALVLTGENAAPVPETPRAAVQVTPVFVAPPLAAPISDRPYVSPVIAPTIFIPVQKTAPPQQRIELMSRDEFFAAMASTSWRSFIINDPAMKTLLWELVKCESGTTEGKVRTQEIGDLDIGYTSIGVFQINIDVWPELARRYNLFVPDENMQAAFEIWESPLGFDNWSCFPVVKEYFD
jgi:hypothetical protein